MESEVERCKTDKQMFQELSEKSKAEVKPLEEKINELAEEAKAQSQKKEDQITNLRSELNEVISKL